MQRFAFYVVMACVMGACGEDPEPTPVLHSGDQTKCVCKPIMRLEWDSGQSVCNNATFDWLLTTILAKVSKQNENLEANSEEIKQHQATLGERNVEIDRLNKLVDEQAYTITSLTQQKEELANQIAQMMDEIDQLDASLTQSQPRPRDCADVVRHGYHYSGIYTVYPPIYPGGMEVFCDLNTDGGGWTVFQRRQDGSMPFDRNWDAYKEGFGKNAKEFWLGNDVINSLTKQRTYELRVDMTGWDDGKSYFAKYAHFSIGNEASLYKLNIGKYIDGDAGDALGSHDGKPFSTVDKDNDNSKSGNCAELFGGGGWWYDRCYDSNLNGLYADRHFFETIVWYQLHKNHEPLKYVEMKFRPVGFRH